VYGAETQSRLSCGGSPQAYKPHRIGIREEEEEGEERSEGCREGGKIEEYLHVPCVLLDLF